MNECVTNFSIGILFFIISSTVFLKSILDLLTLIKSISLILILCGLILRKSEVGIPTIISFPDFFQACMDKLMELLFVMQSKTTSNLSNKFFAEVLRLEFII